MPDAHSDGTPQEKRTATEFINSPQTGKGGHNVDDGGDDGNGEGILNTGVLEVLCSVVEDEVNSRELLESLSGHSSELTFEHRPTEAVDIACLAKTELIFVIGTDLPQFCGNGRVVGRKPSQLTERTGSPFVVSFLDQKSGGFGKNEHTNNQDDGPSELHGDWDSVTSGVVTVLSRVVHNGRQE